MLILAILLSAVLSYLLGSFNSSILVVRLLKHKDIRDYGSHNAGLTNTLRCFGKGCAALTLVGDLAKGIIAVLLSRGICELLHTCRQGKGGSRSSADPAVHRMPGPGMQSVPDAPETGLFRQGQRHL